MPERERNSLVRISFHSRHLYSSYVVFKAKKFSKGKSIKKNLKMSSDMPELGSKISLISKADIRYEGRLFTVDPQECTIALANGM